MPSGRIRRSGVLAVLIWALVLLAAGLFLLQHGVGQLRRRGVFRAVFWQTLRQFAGYRGRELRSLGWSAAGAGLFVAGAALLYQWIMAYYAVRFGRPAS